MRRIAHRRSKWKRFTLGLPLLLIASLVAHAQVAVTTQHNDISRTGQNLDETVLNTGSVDVSNFGKLFSRQVDGYIYAQPLYIAKLAIAGQSHNLVYVATEHNSVYAFDADDPNASSPLWQVNLGTSVPSQDICTSNVPGCPYNDLVPEIGITATPVIDLTSKTIYVVAKTKNTRNNTYHFFLHALDLAMGTEKFLGPVEVTASGFSPLYHLNRPGLLLLSGTLYIGFGSVGDLYSWHGWLMAYDASTLQQTGIFNLTPNGYGGSIWGGGQGLLADSDSIYFMTGNGTFDANTGGHDYGDSLLKLSPGLTLADYFTPKNQSLLSQDDVDLGSGGPMALPGTNLIVGVGKDGVLRLLDATKLGGFSAVSDNDVQEFPAMAGSCGGVSGLCFMGGPIYWNSPNFGPVIYLWGAGDYLKAWQFNGQTFQTTPVSQSAIQSVAGLSNTMAMSLSADGNESGTGIVWASGPMSGDANVQAQPGILHAFDATDLKDELWNSNQSPARDSAGNYAKFAPPTIANGKVYLATFSGQLVVYGLNPPPASAISFVQVAAATPQSLTSTVSVAYPSPQIAGDLNVVVVGWNDTTAGVQSVTDSLENTYARAVGPTKGNGISQSIYYAKNIIAGSNRVTVTFNQSAVSPDIRVLEYAGANRTSPLDVTAAASGSGTTTNSGSATTKFASELIFGANTVFTGNKGPGTGFTARIITSPDSDLAEDEVVSVTGSYSATAPLGSSGNWVMQMATFKP